jgi:competence protein ComEA
MRIHLVTLALCGVLFVAAPGFAFGTPLTTVQSQEQAAAPAKPTVNLNTATVDQLTTLPGIGAKTAELIIEYRTKSGGFKKIEELMNIKGIGEKTFLKLKPLVSAPPKTDKTGA